LRRGFGPANAGGFQANQEMLSQSDSQNLQTEIDRLQTQAESMQRSLDAINERLTEMGKNK
jgi:peptidoglycan hydrolase CwlO-like protein